MPRSAPARSLPAPRLAILGALLLAVALTVAGCAKTAAIPPTGGTTEASKGAADAPSPAQYADIPIPRGATRNIDKTVVVGTRTWYGQLSLDTSYGADAMFNFYARELPNYGWRKIAAVRAPVSVLSYDREDRVLTIAIQPNRLRGSEITVTVSPREDAPPMGAPGVPMPAPTLPVTPAPPRLGQ